MLQKLHFEVMLLVDNDIWRCLAVPFGRIAHWKASKARGSLHDLEHGRWCCHGCYDRWHHVAEALRSCCHQPCSILFLRLLRWRTPAVGTLVRAHTEGQWQDPPPPSLLPAAAPVVASVVAPPAASPARAGSFLAVATSSGKPVTRSAGLGNPSW